MHGREGAKSVGLNATVSNKSQQIVKKRVASGLKIYPALDFP